ncbi:unnamed protein product [Parascedosporium putredinis]|uniref:Uncharacterized protein n=1 Tax=Parascedosporium putredinis TaxID=1442378 RepID=A0A9P1H197_9PEZI|nr:unnamed protein product [Parascedosporium putredinis]CAI7993552.1 unnamed protein product [Parascedosporium putredinis]
MQFSKAILSAALIAFPMTAMAAPAADSVSAVEARAPSDIDALVAELVALTDSNEPADIEARSLELEARGGWTCSFLAGNKGCQVKCFLLKGSGGYCNKKK